MCEIHGQHVVGGIITFTGGDPSTCKNPDELTIYIPRISDQAGELQNAMRSQDQQPFISAASDGQLTLDLDKLRGSMVLPSKEWLKGTITVSPQYDDDRFIVTLTRDMLEK
jgi:hypothetical protein